MKRVLPIFLIVLFLANSIGITFLFLHERNMLKNEFRNYMKNNIDRNKLIKIILPKSAVLDELIHKTDKDEFRFHGNMYDIVVQSETRDSIIYYCLNDEKEEKLIKGFSDLVNSSTEQNSPLKKCVENILKYLSIGFLELIEKKINIVQSTYISIKNVILPASAICEIISPPPEK